MLHGLEAWIREMERIKGLNLPLEDFYVHFRKEVNELVTDRNNGEMVDVINTLGMLYVNGGYRVTFQDCVNKLRERSKKYEEQRQKP